MKRGTVVPCHHTLKWSAKIMLSFVLVFLVGCAGETFLQRITDKQGNILIESQKWVIQTTQIFVVHQAVSGEITFFKIPEAELKTEAWYTYDFRGGTKEHPAGMSAVHAEGDKYIKQKNRKIGTPFGPYFDQRSNPFYGILLDNSTELEKIDRSISLPLAPPQNTSSAWKLEHLPQKTRDDLALSNELASLPFSNTQINILNRNGKYYIESKSTKGGIGLGFFVDRSSSQQFRLIAYTKEASR